MSQEQNGWGELFKQQGAQVLWVETDFIHREVKRCGVHLTICFIDTVPYRKNLSVGVCIPSMILPEKRKKSEKRTGRYGLYDPSGKFLAAAGDRLRGNEQGGPCV